MSKKLVALVLAFALVFSSFTAAFAAEALPADAQAAVTLGMLKGDTSAGVTSTYLATAPTRLQAAILFLRLKGLENEALAYSSAVNFPDANTVKWAGGRNIMAYLKNHPELGWQGDNGNFKPNDKMAAQAYYKVMLESLGYKQNTTDVIGDFTYDQTIAFAASKGLTQVAGVTNFTIANVATATIEALKANVKGSTKTLAASLVEAGIINAQAAVAAGVYTVAPTALAVDSVSAINNKEVVVTFNNDVDKATAEVAGNYTFTGGLTATAAVLSGKAVTVTLAAPAAQQASIDVTVQNVKDASGVAIVKATKTVKFFDTTVPSVASVTVTSPTTLKVTFSEPINSALITDSANFVIDNNTYSIASISGTAGNNYVVVNLGAALPVGSHTLTVNAAGMTAANAIKDYVGFSVPKTDVAFTYAADKVAPTVSLVSASQNSVKIKFSKAISAASQGYLSVYHTYNNNGSYQSATPVWDADNQTVTIPFTANYLPIGAATIYVNAGTAPNVLVDGWGNAFASTTLTTAITADTTAPTVTNIKVVNSTTIEVTYSEAVSGANVASNYTLKDSTNALVGVTSAILKSGTTATYTLTTATMNGGSYTLAIKGIKDTSVSTNAMADYTAAVAVTDLIRPTVTGTGVFSTDAKKIVVTFSEAMATTGANSILNASNYQINLTGSYVDLSTLTGVTIAAGAGNKSVIITSPTAISGLNAADVVRVGRVADAAGNLTAGFTTDVTLAADDVTTANVDATKVKAITKNTVTFDVNTTLSAIDVSKFNIQVGGADIAATSATYVNGDNKATVTVVIPAGSVFATDLANLQNVEFTAGALTTTLGTSNTGTVTTAITAATADYVAPSVVSTVTGDTNTNGHLDKITVTYSEALYVASVTDSDYTVEGYEVTGVSVSGNVVTINVKELASFDTGVTPKVTLVGAIADNSAQRNSLGAQAAVTSTDGAAPVVTQQITAAGTLTANGTHTLAFSEALNAASLTAVKTAVDAAFTESGAATVSSAWDSGKTTLTVTITGFVASPADNITLAAIANQAVTDAASNASAARDVKQ